MQKNHILLTIFAITLIVACASATNVNTTFPALNMPMNSTFSDASLNGATVTSNSATISTTTYKFGGGSGYFDGTSTNYLSVAASSNYNPSTGSISYAFWYYPISNVNSAAPLLLNSDGADKNAVGFRYHNTNLAFLAGDGSTYKSVDAASNPSTGNWHYIVGIVDRTTNQLKFYVDGVSQGTADITGFSILDVSSTPLLIGKYPYSTPAFINGYVDDVEIYKGVVIDPTIIPDAQIIVNPAASQTANVTSGLSPLAVQFTNTSVGNTANSYHNWSMANSSVTGGNGTVIYFSNAASPLQTFGTGNWSIAHNVVNQFGTSTSTSWVNVSRSDIPPASSFTSNVTYGVNPVSVQFNDTSLYSPTAWSWNFGDTGTSTLQNPVHTYGSGGNYTVALNASNVYGYNISYKYINVYNQTTAAFTANTTYGISPLTVQFTDASINTTPTASYYWDLGDGNTSTLQNPSHTYYAVGSYNISHRASNGYSTNWTNQTNYITVIYIPDPNPTSMIKYKNAESSVSINNLSAPYVGTVTARNITSNTTYVQGTFTWATGNILVDNIRVNTSSANISGASLVSSSVDNTHGIGTFNLTKATGFTSPANALIDFNITYTTYANPGTRVNFSYTLIQCKYYDPGNSTWWTFGQYQGADAIIGVWGPITPTFTGSPTTVAAGDPVTFTASATGYPDSWSWNFGDSNTSVFQNPSHTYSTAGTYTVAATAYLAANSSVTGTQTRINYITVVNATSAPVANFTAANTTIPVGGTAVFTDTSTNHPASWSWNFGDGGTSTLQNPSHTYSSTGYFNVTLTATNDVGSNTTVKPNYIFVTYITPVASFTTNTSSGPYPLTVQFNDTSTNIPSSWSWNFGDTGTSTLQNPVHTYTTAGNFTVTFTAANTGGSNTTTGHILVHVPSGVTRQDLAMLPYYSLAITFVDATTGSVVSNVKVIDSTGVTSNVTNGIFTSAYPYGIVTITYSSPGYYGGSVTYAITQNLVETIKMTGETTSSTSTTWYTPKTISIKLVDSYGNPITGATLHAQYNSTTLPSGVSDLINNFGMNSAAANQALNGTIIMTGTTDSTGSVVFTMLSTVSYDLTATYNGASNYYSLYPQYTDYQFKFLVGSTVDNIYNDLYANGNTKVWATEPNISYVTFWWSFQDMTNLTTQIDYYLKDVDLNTTVYTTSISSPVAGSIYQLNYTVSNVRGKNYMAWENYTRNA